MFAVAWEPEATLSALPVLAAALARAVRRGVRDDVRTRGARGTASAVATLARAYRWVFSVDALLTPAGFLAAVASEALWPGDVPVRRAAAPAAPRLRASGDPIDHALELSARLSRDRDAPRRHGRDRRRIHRRPQPRRRRVVLDVGTSWGSTRVRRRRAEFAALLHDVGKIRSQTRSSTSPENSRPKSGPDADPHSRGRARCSNRVGGSWATSAASCAPVMSARTVTGIPTALPPTRSHRGEHRLRRDAFSAMTTPRLPGRPLARARRSQSSHAAQAPSSTPRRSRGRYRRTPVDPPAALSHTAPRDRV